MCYIRSPVILILIAFKLRIYCHELIDLITNLEDGKTQLIFYFFIGGLIYYALWQRKLVHV